MANPPPHIGPNEYVRSTNSPPWSSRMKHSIVPSECDLYLPPFRRSPPYFVIYNSPAFTHKFAQTKNVKYRKWVLSLPYSRVSPIVENHGSSYHCTFVSFRSTSHWPGFYQVCPVSTTHTHPLEIEQHLWSTLTDWTDPYGSWNYSIGVCSLDSVSVAPLVPGNIHRYPSGASIPLWCYMRLNPHPLPTLIVVRLCRSWQPQGWASGLGPRVPRLLVRLEIPDQVFCRARIPCHCHRQRRLRPDRKFSLLLFISSIRRIFSLFFTFQSTPPFWIVVHGVGSTISHKSLPFQSCH